MLSRVQFLRKKAQKNDSQLEKLEDAEDKIRTSLRATLLKDDNSDGDSDGDNPTTRHKDGDSDTELNFYDENHFSKALQPASVASYEDLNC